ncbi:MAG: hypothetical protein PHQ09_02090 [Actinomycetota bacterium]|nr:hypothetical protein [Actinomycetota bacterium]
MKKVKWQLILGVILISLSVLLYIFHYIIFKDIHHIFIYLMGDIAFLPIEVFLVTVVIHRLMSDREKKALLTKLNMVIGAFFSEVGTKLLIFLSDYDKNSNALIDHLSGVKTWTARDFKEIYKKLKSYQSDIKINPENLEDLKKFLIKKREFLLRLLENPNLLEHESFTDLLWAVFHLTEELEKREDCKKLPDADYDHLIGDTKRAYGIMILEWIAYMSHLKNNYPYLFSLAIRTNPFDLKASPVIMTD